MATAATREKVFAAFPVLSLHNILPGSNGETSKKRSKKKAVDYPSDYKVCFHVEMICLPTSSLIRYGAHLKFGKKSVLYDLQVEDVGIVYFREMSELAYRKGSKRNVGGRIEEKQGIWKSIPRGVCAVVLKQKLSC